MYLLSKKDKRLLEELDENARQSITSIAKNIGVSKEVARYRMQRLEKDNVITVYYPILDISTINYAFFRVLLSFENITPEKEQELITHLQSQPNIAWLATLEGNWDLVLVIWSKNVYDFKEKIDLVLANYNMHIKEKIVTIATKIYHFKKKYLYETTTDSCLLYGEHKKTMEIDAIDYQILLALSMDARTPLTTIAKNTKLTANAVNYRIKRMEKGGLILGYRANININKLSLQHFKVFLYIHATTKSEKKRLIEYLSRNPHVVYITEAVGPSDIEFEVHMKNSTLLFQFIKSLRADFQKIIKDYDVLLTYKEHRINYLPEI